MTNLKDQWIEIFRAGNYGAKGKFSEQDIDQLIADAAMTDSVPVVIGHPANDGPAYGWVSQLKRIGKTLLAKLKDVTPQLEKAVRGGSFKKRSVALRVGPDGKRTLRHVGFLGAMPPEVKGLADIQFAESDEDADQPFTKDMVRATLRHFFAEHSMFSEETAADDGIGFNAAPGLSLDHASVEFARHCERYAAQKQISFAEAMQQLGEKRDAIAGAIREFFTSTAEHTPAQCREAKASSIAFNATPGIALDEASVRLAEECIRRANAKRITFGQAMRELREERVNFNECPGVSLDRVSVELVKKCQQRANARGITFCEAMRELNSI